MDGVEARRIYLAENCTCASEQHYQYRWDELNRLVEARRYDRADGSGDYALAARQRYRYDASNQRVVKQTLGDAGEERIALEVFGGDFERRGVERDGSSYVPAGTGRQEDQYLVAGARMVWTTAAGGEDADHRITVALADLIGTSSAVVDLVSGELVETSTYLPSGGREGFRASGEIGAEPAGFTGKEGEEEVGVTYFGERWLIARVGRWATPDPLSVHALGGGEFGNSYHYVAGSLLQARDPIGLDPKEGTQGASAPPPVAAPSPSLTPEQQVARESGRAEAERHYRSQGFADYLNEHHIGVTAFDPEDLSKIRDQQQVAWDVERGEWRSTRVLTLDNDEQTFVGFRERYTELKGTELAIDTLAIVALIQVSKAGQRILILGKSASSALRKEIRAAESAIRANRALDEEVASMTKRERADVATMIGAYDPSTGQIAVGRSGVNPTNVHPELQKRVTDSGLKIGEKVLCDFPVGNCAEFDAANQLLQNGSNIDDIRFTSPTRPRSNFDPSVDSTKKPCAHCSAMGLK